jgi:hypothetical protein
MRRFDLGDLSLVADRRSGQQDFPRRYYTTYPGIAMAAARKSTGPPIYAL